eukprot:superscaffoldBa00005912_g20930
MRERGRCGGRVQGGGGQLDFKRASSLSRVVRTGTGRCFAKQPGVKLAAGSLAGRPSCFLKEEEEEARGPPEGTPS